ncbi:DnaD domain-containing protein [Dubosiella muris]|uniref:DnaD domain protein n=2 Tax=Dubosiella TaxID=1937008 RepID=A0AC61R7B9_9FIRM|nr:DnaD domain protein [Dubosiella muris]TGY65783.1 DnaD domain protein [Dubosiella muris]
MAQNIDWSAPWIDQCAWIFSNLENLTLDAKEALIVLLIAHYNRHDLPISTEAFAQKAKISEEEVDTIFQILSTKGYLTIDFVNGKVVFCLDGLVRMTRVPGKQLSKSLISEFEDEFGRDLSPQEMQKILDLSEKFTERQVICALNEASVYNKRNLTYIENVLISWSNKGLSTEDIESGIR